MDSKVPDGRCGFRLSPDQILKPGFTDFEDSNWFAQFEIATCYRETWQETGRCIWHADVDEKPIEELKNARGDKGERLDGAILRGLELNDQISFSNCRLPAADISKTILRNADLSNANLMRANFSGAILTESNLKNANLAWANLTKAIFTKARMQSASLEEAVLSEANFEWVNLTAADIRKADLSGASFWRSELTRANLIRADLSGANLSSAVLSHAVLEDATLEGADLRRTNLRKARLYQAYFSDTRINSHTSFGEKCWYDDPECYTEIDAHSWNWIATSVDEAAIWTYRRLEDIHQEYAQTKQAIQYHVAKEEAERSLYWKERRYGGWGVKTLMRSLTNYGESVRRVLIWWAVVILGAGALFPFIGGIKDSEGTKYAIQPLSELGTFSGWNEVLLNVYFSVITFSTIGYGDLSPASPLSRGLVAVESIAGALLLALLIFVVGRRVSR